MINEAGSVTLDSDMIPAMWSMLEIVSNKPQTDYGFADATSGDSTQLVYLRARWYNPADGRFQSRDTWGGDANRPISLNRWMYVEGNPVNFSDPTGNIPTQQEVATGRQVYSCNCGWIDFGHAGSRLALSIINLLNEEKEHFYSNHYSPVSRDDVFAISPSAEISIWKLYDQTVSLTAVVQTGLDDATKESVALGIFRNLEEKIEDTQGDKGMWFTAYSFEDLTSDEIGFYMALKYGKVVNPADDGSAKNNNAWNYLASVCGFPENRQQAIDRSLDAYENMNIDSLWGEPFMRLITDTPHIYSWGTPMLCELNGLCDGEPMRWPVEFTSIRPAQPSRNGLWWIYDKSLDGRLFSPDAEFSKVHR